jgi:glycosyltransferase involved in cell wall biosynthesis
MAEPFITIVVPTRERCETLGPTLRTCVTQDYDALEILVSDNASSDATREVVTSFADPRIRYENPGRRLSMTGNFEFALSNLRPGFVISIGDDDGVMPGAIRRMSDVLRQTGLKAVASSSVFYVWPNFPAEHMRNLMLIRDTRKGLSILDGRREAARRASFRTDTYRYAWGLPTVYRGLIATEVIDRARRNGRYFHSVTPDAYSGFVNCFHLDRYAYCREPMTVEGVSGRSNGAAQLVAKDRSEEVRYLQENDIAFAPELVYTPASPVILAEAFLQARAQFPESAAQIDFDVGRACRQALRESANGPNAERVRSAVKQMCQRHGLDDPPAMTPIDRTLEALKRLRGVLHMRELDASRLGVQDVYQASLLADRILHDRRAKEGIGGAALVLRKIAMKIAQVPARVRTRTGASA